MSTFQVNSEAIASASAGVQASIGSINHEVARMNARLAELLQSWSGQAAAAFGGTMEQWRSAQASLEQALDSIAQALARAGQTYSEVEAANVALFAQG